MICWLEMYPEDFRANDGYVRSESTESSNISIHKNFESLAQLIDFAKSKNLHELKRKARKILNTLIRYAQQGGILCAFLIIYLEHRN